MAHNEGVIAQVIGPVVDIDSGRYYRKILHCYQKFQEKFGRNRRKKLIVEAQQHLGENRVRTVAMDTTDGLVRGMKALISGNPISVPVGAETLGRLINVIGEGIDGLEK